MTINDSRWIKGDTNLKTDVKKDFEEFNDDALGILLYGSHAQGCWSERSDIDICIVAPGNDYVLRRINKRLGGKYDVKVFEEIPRYIPIEIIHNHQIIYGDAARIGAYFYSFRRLWADMEPRIRDNRFSSAGERMALWRGLLRYLYSSKRSML